MRTFVIIVLHGLILSSANAATHTRYEGKDTKEVIKAAENYDPGAIEELGVRQERSSLDLLTRVAGESDVVEPPAKVRPSWAETKAAMKAQRRNESHVSARIALAKMGEKRYLNDIIAGLSSPNPDRRAKCIGYLGRIGDKGAVKSLIPILDDNNSPPKKRHGHVRNPTFAMMAADSLRLILPDAEKQFLADSNGNGYVPIKAWKAWWEKHKSEF
jgi:HEAT repeat protein